MQAKEKEITSNTEQVETTEVENQFFLDLVAATREQEILLRRHGARQSVPQFVVLEPDSPHLRDAA